MKVPKSITAYDQVTFDPLKFVERIPEFEDSEASTGFCDLSAVIKRLNGWQAECPSICPIFVLRRNDDFLVKTVSKFGCRFVCSSRGEADELFRNDVSVEKITWGNAVLSLRDCKYARVAKIQWIQVGRTEALRNLKLGHPEGSIILNVSLPSQDLLNGGSQLGFSHTETEFAESLLLAKELDLNVRGIALTKNANWSEISLEDVFYKAKELVLLAESVGFVIESLTIPEVIHDVSLDTLLASLKLMKELEGKFFADCPGMKIFCETNDSLTTASLCIFMTVQAVRKIRIEGADEETVQYFVDDGRHNSFRKVPRTIRHSEVHYIRRSPVNTINPTLYLTEVYGPSCDGDDIVVDNFRMPELSNGDLIYLTNVGTDTISMRTNFNGFMNCNCHYFIQRNDVVGNDQQGRF